jgi:hypothetical protein
MPTPLNILYQDPDGNTWSLSDPSMAQGFICTGLNGIEGIPVSMQTVPLLDGTAIPSIYIPQPGSIAMGILVAPPAGSSDEDDDYYLNLDKVVRAFLSRRNEVATPGYLIVQRPNGTMRQIAVYTTSGLDTPEVGLNNMTVYTLTLQTPDPYWEDLVPQQVVFSISNASGILPLLPIRLAGSSVIGAAAVNNAGTAIAYPTWIITGPGTPTFTNLTTGFTWSLNTPIPAGNVVQVTTQPGTQMAVNQTTSTNIWDQLVLSSLRSLWGLVGGVNEINVAMAGSSLATSVSLQWTNRWSRA